MTAEDPQNNTPSDPSDASETDAAASGPSAADAPSLPETPALNREQRRAQSKGKKGTTPGFHPANAANMRGGGGGRPANAPIQNKIPRTGHK